MIRSDSVGSSIGVTRSQTRLDGRTADVRIVQRATTSIVDLNTALDRALRDERRPDERLQMLRATTHQITRGANDAIQAYRRASAAVHAELQMPGGDRQQADHLRLLLDAARADLLRVLEVSSHRYAWAEPWRRNSGTSHPAAAKDVGCHGQRRRACPPPSSRGRPLAEGGPGGAR